MLLADRFTYVHEPKTGGTFVTHALTQVHGSLTDIRPMRFLRHSFRCRLPTASFYAERLAAPRGLGAGIESRYGRLYNWNDHGTCSEIPRPFRSVQILATVRNPFQTYVSDYLFGWWKRPEHIPHYRRTVRDFQARYPSFPDLSFREYLELLHAAWILPRGAGFYEAGGVGYLTERFVRFYFSTPWILRCTRYATASAVKKLSGGRADAAARPAGMFPVRFLRTSRLNTDLEATLLELGYEQEDVQIVGGLKHVRPVGGAEIGFADQAASHDWTSFYTSDIAEAVRRKDDLIFRLFPEFDEVRATVSSP